MDTTTNIEKQAAILGPIAKILGIAQGATSELFKAYLTWAAAAGLIGGAATGLASSSIKAKNPEVTKLERHKRYYDKKIEELENENWLNDLMTTKKKLDTSKLSDTDRKELENKYINLINK